MPWTWYVKKGGGDVGIVLIVGELKAAIAGIARLRAGQQSWIDPLLDIERTDGERSASAPFITSAPVNASFGFGVRAISVSQSATAPLLVAVKQDGAIVLAKKSKTVSNGTGSNHQPPYAPVALMDAPELKKGSKFGLESFSIFVTA